MKISTSIVIALCLLVVTAFLCACFGWAAYLNIRVRAALAEEQTLYFEEVVQEAVSQQTSEKVAAYIEAIKIYYPSGSKQKPGTHLDLMVERSRTQAITRLEQLRSALAKQETPKNELDTPTNAVAVP